MNIENKQKEYYSDSHCIFSMQYHVVFCTKYRRKIFDNDIICDRTKELILSKQLEYKFGLIDFEILPEHIHMLIDVKHPKQSIYSIISKIKGFLSNTLRKEYPELKKRIPCLWTRGKFISSVGSVSLETVKKYIENQRRS
jgi:putative transposase